MMDTSFYKNIAVQGAVLHASLQSTQSEIDLTNIYIEGPGDLEGIYI